MDLTLFERKSEFEWRIRPFGKMRVPGVIFASEALMREMDAKVYEQVTNVAMLPGIVKRLLCHAGCALGLRLSHRRRGGIRCRQRAAWCRRAAWVSISPAACARCLPA